MSNDTEPTEAFPPRFWWLKRLTAAAVVAAVALVALWHWWDRQAQRRLDTYLQAARARGEPLVAADFDPPAVPAEQDASAMYRQAAQTLTGQQLYGVVERVIPFTLPELARVQAILQSESQALAQARAARGLSRRDGGVRVAQPLLARRLSVSPTWELIPLLHFQALYRHQVGDDAEAVEAVRDILALADVSQRDTSYAYAGRVAGEVDYWAVDAVSQMAPALAVQGEALPTRSAYNPASAAQVKALIRELLDERPAQEAFVRAIWLERAMVLEALPSLELAALPGLAGVVGPAWKADAVPLLQRFDAEARAATQPTHRAGKALLPPSPPHGVSRLESVARGVSRVERITLQSFDRHHRRLTERRLAAVALAVKLYRADHAGAWPQTLESLVPAYLPAVPGDPFNPRGGPLRYLLSGPAQTLTEGASPAPTARAGPTGPIAYSVGVDGIDDGGSRDGRAWRGRSGRWDWDDAVLLLAENPEIRDPAFDDASSRQAQEDDPQEGDDSGKDDQRQDPQQQPQDRQ